MPTFDYSNLSERGPGPILRVAGRLLPGVAQVHGDTDPFAAAWREDNLAALAAPPGSGPLWVALGDSLTQGLGAPSHDLGWVGVLRSRFAAAGRPVRVVNLGVSGATVDDVTTRQLPVLRALGEAPALVTLMVGSNDLMKPGARRTLPARYEQLLRELPAGAIVTTLPNPTRPAVAANESLHRLAGELGLRVVEMRRPELSSWRGRLAADHFHPNAAGYAAIADVLEAPVTEALADVRSLD